MLIASVSPLWGIAGSVIALFAAVTVQVLIAWRASRDRRRDEYSAAFAAALGWCELPYKVARRLSNDREDVAPIIDAFHKAQSDLFFHRMWMRSVSTDTAAAYERLVDAVKAQTSVHSNQAWQADPWQPAADPLGPRYLIDVDAEREAFIAAVQRDLSVWKRLASPAVAESASYDARFRRLYGRKSFTAYLAGGLAVGGLLAEHHLWPVFVVVVAAAASPTVLAITEMSAARRRTWLLATALIYTFLFTLAALKGFVAGLLGVGVLAVAIYARDALVDRPKHGERSQAEPRMPLDDQIDRQGEQKEGVQPEE